MGYRSRSDGILIPDGNRCHNLTSANLRVSRTELRHTHDRVPRSMIDQQTKAEHQFAHLLGRVRFADQQAAALLLIDQELNQGQSQPEKSQG